MNLYLRFLRILIQCLFAKKINLLDASRLTFFVWPWDCDLNFHMTNSRYFSMMDLGRVFFMRQIGVLKKTVKRKWFPVVHSIEFSFIRALPPLVKFTMRTRLVTWDEKYLYLETRFESHGKLYAIGFVRGLFLQGKEIVSTHEIINLIDDKPPTPPAAPVVIQRWRDLLAAKRDHQPF